MSEDSPREPSGNWTGAVQRFATRTLPFRKLLPERQPAYVASWIYVFGVLTIAALVWVIVSGVVLAFFGPQWWHDTAVGHFFNSLHFWSVQVFFAFMVLHLWGQYFAAAWRKGRQPTWIAGAVIFLVSIVAAFTGYLSQQNLDSQWIAINAKDAVNASGAGGFFNVLNFGQMYGLHVMLIPALVIVLVAVHILLVRVRGVVPPIGDGER